MPRQRLAKLTRPRLHGALARERLFRAMDERRERPVAWVVGPPGAGKTTLVASYLEASAAPVIWYHLDRSDSDPATFFYYLAQAVENSAPGRGRRLPLLTTEYLTDLEGFGRRFMRDVFAGLSQGSLLVFDNYHTIAVNSELHRMLNAAISEVPESANMVFISREQPPAVFAREQIAGNLQFLGWEDLRLDRDETAALVTRRGLSDARFANAIHNASGGWVAGVRLLLERSDSLETSATFAAGDALEMAFDYFATEIFDAAPLGLKDLLLRTAHLPRFTVAMAAALSGNTEAGSHIEHMYRRRLFIDRRVGNTITYQYHDLFRAFLRDRAAQTFSQSELSSLAAASAGLLIEENLADEAFELLVEAKDWDQAEQLLLDRAETLIAHGRWQTLDVWGESLPGERLAGNPWVQYWLGRSKALVDSSSAFSILQTTYDSFTQLGDSFGQLQCAATVVETLHFVVTDWSTMGLWLDRLKTCVEWHKGSLSPDDELRIHAALFWAAENSDPCDAVVARSVARTLQLLPHCVDVNLRITVANILHYHSDRAMDAEATRIAAREARRVLDSKDLSADRHALYYLSEGFAHFAFARYREAFECFNRAEELIEEHGLVGRGHILTVWRALGSYAAGDLDDAYEALCLAEEKKTAGLHVIDQVLLAASAWIAFARGEIDLALKHNQAAIRICDTLGPRCGISVYLPNRAYMLIAAGRIEPARAPLERICTEPGLIAYEAMTSSICLLQAWLALKLGLQSQCHSALREALALAALDERERLRMRWFPNAIAELFPIALDLGIEPETARTIIRIARVVPPPSAPDSWPWPIKIYSLHRFEVMLDDRPLEHGRKAPKRTIALLKVIIAFGGTDVPEQRLADALWPDLEGDAALESLAAALHRLRRLLGSSEAIQQSNRCLSLNRQHCFVDAWAFEMGVQTPQTAPAALRLYRGDFLQGDVDAPWSASLRERLRSKFVRAIQSIGAELEESGRHLEALEYYARGLEADDLVESFYQGSIRSLFRLNRGAEAASMFRRLRQTLSIKLGLPPSPESQTLFDTLRAD